MVKMDKDDEEEIGKKQELRMLELVHAAATWEMYVGSMYVSLSISLQI